MSSESLPDLFWNVYYLFLVVTFVLSIYGAIKQKVRYFSLINLLVIITVFPLNFINGFYRGRGQTELDYLLQSLSNGSPWAIYVVLGYVYMFVWWGLLIADGVKRKKREMTKSQ